MSSGADSDESMSHNAALNHCTKGRSPSLWATTLPRCRRSLFSGVRAESTADHLRRLMRDLRYPERIVAGESSCCLRAASSTRGKPSSILGDYSATLFWRDPDGYLALAVQFWVWRNGRIGASGLLDPKVIRDDRDGVSYSLRNEPPEIEVDGTKERDATNGS